MDRRTLLAGALLGGARLAAGSPLVDSLRQLLPVGAKVAGVKGQRFVTFCIMIRTTPWEVSRDVKLMARDEASWHTLEGVKAMREAFGRGNPEGRLTWGFTLNALEDKRLNFSQIRAYAVECHERFGDEVSYFPGYFPAMYLPRARINREMTEAIETISAMVGKGYRPQAIMGGFLSANNLAYLAEKEKIHVAHAVIWSQYAVDGGGADGSPSYPFYPSKEHFCKPAQGVGDFIDCVNLDGWTMDFICARRSGSLGQKITGYNSRRGVGPLETYVGWGLDLGHREVMHTQAVHFDEGFTRNGFAWVTNIWEAEMVGEFGQEMVCTALERWVSDTKRRWPDTQFVSFGEFGMRWRAEHRTNEDWSYSFLERGSGLGDSYNNLEIEWFMNKSVRLARLRDWHEGSAWRVIDLTRYDFTAKEPADPDPAHPVKDWSLMNRINQKGLRAQDKPVLMSELTSEDRNFLRTALPGLLGI
jgi:hypothetical protein